MAGRPRTTLKRIVEWEPLAERLYEEIRKRIPPAYLDYDVDYLNDHAEYIGQPDGDGGVWITDFPHHDDVGYCWKSALDAAEELHASLMILERAIRERLEQKGVRIDETRIPLASQTGQPTPAHVNPPQRSTHAADTRRG